MSGELAARWGNDHFARPEIDFERVVTAVTLHDWHYRLIDDIPIGEASDEAWLAVTHKGVEGRFDDPVVDIMVNLHLRRLLGFGIHITDEVPRLVAEIDSQIEQRLPESDYSRDQFEWADKITRFCDFLVFDFCFEKPVERTIGVCAQVGTLTETELTTAVHSGGRITVDPWPFTVDHFSGLIIGHERDRYPERLVPVVVPYTVSQRVGGPVA